MIGRHFVSPLLYDERAPDDTSGHSKMLTIGPREEVPSNHALLARSSESTDRSGVWTFALGVAVYGLPPLKGERTEPGITSLGAEVDWPGLAHPTARLSPPPASFCSAST